MPFFEVSQADYYFLKELSSKMRSQDRRATADPYYYTIRKIKYLPAPDDYGDRQMHVAADHEDGWYKDFADYKARKGEKGVTTRQLQKQFDALEVMQVHEVEEHENFFFTFDGYQDHLRRNRHNISSEEPLSSYVHHAYRNTELETVIRLIHHFGDEKKAIIEPDLKGPSFDEWCCTNAGTGSACMWAENIREDHEGFADFLLYAQQREEELLKRITLLEHEVKELTEAD